MKRIMLLGLMVAALGLGAVGCQDKSQAVAPETAKSAEPLRPAVTVEVVPVKSASVEEVLELIGSIKPKFEATVRSEFTGKLAEVYITEWVTVKKGQPLARLDTSEYESQLKGSEAAVAQARADLLRAEANARKAARYDERLASLSNEIISDQNRDDAREQRDTTAADVEAFKAKLMAVEEMQRQVQLKLKKSVLVAPMDGMVANRKANVGQFVDNMGQGDPLFRIVDNSILDVTLTVPSAEMGRVRIGQAVEFTTDFLPGKTFTATVTYMNPAADPATRAVNIVAQVKNPSGVLRDGLFVKGRIVVGRREGVLQIPREALLPGSKGELFVIGTGKARKRAIQTGSEQGDWVEVKSGLQAGEMVVIRGAFMLQEGDPVKVSEAGPLKIETARRD